MEEGLVLHYKFIPKITFKVLILIVVDNGLVPDRGYTLKVTGK